MTSDSVLHSAEPAEPADSARALDPAEALALAERANVAAHRPRLLPGWYGPTFGAILAGYGTLIGISRAYHLTWLLLAGILLFAALMGLVARLGMRSTGVVGRLDDNRAWRGFIRGGTAAVVAVAGVVGLACWPIGGQLAACAGAGVGGGLGFWALMLLANRRVRRERAAA